jgi:hypothetical protein
MLAALLMAAAMAAAPPVVGVHPDERPTYEKMLTKEAQEAEVFAGSPCPTATVEHVSTAPWMIPNYPVLPGWIEHLRVTGCGRTSDLTVWAGRPGGSPPWHLVAGLPGEGLADPVLQRAAFPAAIADARSGLPDACKGERIGNVFVTARQGSIVFTTAPPIAGATGHLRVQLTGDLATQQEQLDLKEAWAEVWPLELCGQDRTTIMVFIPHRDHLHFAYVVLPDWRIIAAGGARPLPAK